MRISVYLMDVDCAVRMELFHVNAKVVVRGEAERKYLSVQVTHVILHYNLKDICSSRKGRTLNWSFTAGVM